MTLQQLRYLIAVAEKGAITEAAKSLFISQPSLSNAIREVEQSIGFRIFNRHRTGVTLTAKGVDFLGHAHQVVWQMDALESKYGDSQETRQRFCVSTQHYTFTANAFVELVKDRGQGQCDFILNETQTHQVVEDVCGRFSDLGVLYLSRIGVGPATLRPMMMGVCLKVRRMNPSIVRQYRSGSLPELSIWLAPGTSSFSLSRLEHAA